MKRIAIVGMSPAHRHLAPYDDPNVEIWTLNQAYWNPQKNEPAAWLKRWDVLFQIHDDATVTHYKNPGHDTHYEWLQQQEKTIYMQRAWDEIPASVRYPKDEIEDYFGFPLYRDDVRMFDPYNEDSQTYYTSTFPYQLALAIYKIETTDEYEPFVYVYGIDAASHSEYSYQKPCIEFWLGITAARGIHVELPNHTALLKSLEYGYDISQLITRETLQRHIDLWKDKSAEWKQKAEAMAKPLHKLMNKGREIPQQQYEEYAEAEAKVGIYQGAVIALEEAMNEMSDRPHLHYQRFDLRRVAMESHMEKAKTSAAGFHALMLDRTFRSRKTGDEELRKEADHFGIEVDKAIKAANAYMGGMQACEAIMDEADGKGAPERLQKTLNIQIEKKV